MGWDTIPDYDYVSLLIISVFVVFYLFVLGLWRCQHAQGRPRQRHGRDPGRRRGQWRRVSAWSLDRRGGLGRDLSDLRQPRSPLLVEKIQVVQNKLQIFTLYPAFRYILHLTENKYLFYFSVVPNVVEGTVWRRQRPPLVAVCPSSRQESTPSDSLQLLAVPGTSARENSPNSNDWYFVANCQKIIYVNMYIYS